ncbi:AsnC family transcriptional regulator [Herbiconiux sp. 11R-BC]|uniref:AsnC family transcriptional regulator n=1 Tax=Herbiconiux sp. 11R-BC TaxID=3111637 RepID=UPI003C0F1CE4
MPETNPLDARIIECLTDAPRMTYAAIAARLGAAETNVRARVKHLLRSETIVPTVIVHPGLSAESIVSISRVQLDHEIDTVADPVLFASPWLAQIVGESALLVQLASASLDELAEQIESIRSLPGVRTIATNVLMRLHITNISPDAAWTDAAAATVHQPDAIDQRLIELLRRDGRSSYTALSQEIGLTVAATRNRVMALESGGTIRFIAHVRDTENTERGLHVELSVTAPAVDEVLHALRSIDAVRYVVQQTGEFNVVAYYVDRAEAHSDSALHAVWDHAEVLAHRTLAVSIIRDRTSWT